MIKPLVVLASMAMGFAAAPATAANPVDSGWSLLSRARDGACVLSVTGNGQFTRIAVTGLGADALGRLILANGDMKPLDWTIRATGDGGFARYYLPFRWHRTGGDVTVSVESTRCDLSTTFAWRRSEVVVR